MQSAPNERKPVPRPSGLKSSKIPITQAQTFSSRNREAQIKAESKEILSEAGKMSAAMKPDYYIAHNGLPNILSIRSRHVITKVTAKSERFASNQQPIHPLARATRFSCVNQQAPVQLQRDTEKNAKNKAIKESLRDSKAQKDLINAQIASGGIWRQPTHTFSGTNCVITDNGDCKR